MKHVLFIIAIMISLTNLTGCAKDGDYQTVSVPQFKEMLQADSSAYVLDVRTPEEYAEGHITDAHNLDWLNQTAFRAGAPELPHDRTIYVYCRSGRRSAEAARYLANLGYHVVDMDGGWLSYTSR